MDYARWCALSDDELARRDIAEVNLAAAYGLPFADDLDIAALCRKLDEWAEVVGRATSRAVQRRRLGDYPELSHSQFRMAVLVSVLRGELGVMSNSWYETQRIDYSAPGRAVIVLEWLICKSNFTAAEGRFNDGKAMVSHGGFARRDSGSLVSQFSKRRPRE